MGGLLTVGQLMAVFSVVFFVLGVVLSQRIKDTIFRVPTSVRTEMTGLEAGIHSRLQAELGSVVQDIKAQIQPQQPVPPVDPVVIPPSPVVVPPTT